MNILYISEPKDCGCDYYRVMLPAAYITDKSEHDARFMRDFEIQPHPVTKRHSLVSNKLDWADIVVLFRHYPKTPPQILVSLIDYVKNKKKKLVYEVDDLVTNVPKHSKFYKLLSTKSEQKMIKYMIDNADLVTTPSKRLTELYAKNGAILPNSIPVSQWEKAKIKDKNKNKMRIGWSGGWSHQKDLDMIENVFWKLKKKFDFELCIFGHNPNFKKVEYKFFSYISMFQYPIKLGSLDNDIAIAPLEETKFNKYKSSIKWVEHGVFKIPMVLSKWGAYEDEVKHGYNGFLASNEKEWVTYLTKLIKDATLRKEIGNNVYNTIKKEYNIETNYKLWIDAYQSLIKEQKNNKTI